MHFIFVFLVLNLPAFLCKLTDIKCFWRINDTKNLDEDCIFMIVLAPETSQKIYFNKFLDEKYLLFFFSLWLLSLIISVSFDSTGQTLNVSFVFLKTLLCKSPKFILYFAGE